MFKYLFVLLFISSCNSFPNKIDSDSDVLKEDIPVIKPNYCCMNHPKKRLNDIFMANYNCSQLSQLGKDRCNSVFGERVCLWDIYKPLLNICSRKIKYEIHKGKKIDVGQCLGKCKLGSDEQICSPSTYEYLELKGASVKIIKDCECSNCGVRHTNTVIEVPSGQCHGKCDNKLDTICRAGVPDSYSLLNGLEATNPSSQLITSAASICSLGIQTGFDTFVDNRCFIHTFNDCFNKHPCPIKTAFLDICMQAAPVPLTNTDSLRLGTNGIGLWGRSLPLLNSGVWNPGNTLCVTLDLDNLPGGVSILNNVILDGHLDVLVQDDTAVDYANVRVLNENCEKCLPIHNIVNSLYTLNGLQEHRNIKDCDCLSVRKCHRERLEETYYPGTFSEITIDIGQCLGGCEQGVCKRSVKGRKIKSPSGARNVNVIEKCYC